MTDPSTRQVGGDHYTKLAIQPFDFTLPLAWDAASHTILKYISRHHNVPREEAIESLRKAHHIVEIIEKNMHQGTFYNTALARALAEGEKSDATTLNISKYCIMNGLDDLETVALTYLAMWLYKVNFVLDGETIWPDERMVKTAIESILVNRYGVYP